MAASTTHSSHMPGLRLRYGRGVGRGRSPPGTAATTQTADGHRMRPVSPCGPPRLAMWRFGCPMIRSDAGGTAGAQSAAARARTECCPRNSHLKPSYPVFFSIGGLLTTEVLGSNLQNRLGMTSLRAQEAKIFRCATSLWRCAPALARTYGGGTTSAGRCRRARASRQSPVCSKFTAKALAGGCSRVSRRVGR